MKKVLTLILLTSLLVMQSCILYGKKDGLSLTTTIKQKTELDSTLTSVNVSNNQVTIQGSGFSNVSTVKLTSSSLNTDLSIDSKTDSQIIAKASSALSLLVGETFNLIIGTADAQATYAVTFALKNGAINLNHLSSLGATTAGQILKFDGASWGIGTLSNSQTYLGTWNATTHLPDITTFGSFNAGDYYIVSTAGSYTSSALVVSPSTFKVGDWIMFNGTSWEQIANNSITGSGTTNFIPYFSSNSVLANSPLSVSGSSVGIGTTTPGSSLDIKGTLRLSGATSGYVGLAPAAVAGATTYTLPAADGSSGQLLSTNGSGELSWTSVSVSGGTVTGVTSANADIGVASGTTAPVLTLNSGTSANQIVKLTSAAKLPAVDGSLLTNLSSSNLVGAVAVANGGTGATTLGASQSALGITIAGPLTGNVPSLGATVIPDRLCASDTSGGTISCINNLPAATVRGSVLGTSGTGNLLFASSPTISSPIITNIAPAADFTLTQNSVVPFTSVNTGAVANTLYLSQGKVGIGLTSPTDRLHVSGGDARFEQNIILTGRGQLRGGTNASDVRLTAAGNLELSPGGNVGIGTGTPAHKLDVAGNARTTGYQYVGSNLGFQGAGTHYIKHESGSSSSDAITFRNLASTDIMTVRMDGNVGIGTSSPTNNLEVGNSATANTSVFLNGNGNVGLNVQSASGSSRKFWWVTDGVNNYFKNTTDNAGQYRVRNSSNLDIFSVDFAAPANSLVVNSSGNVGVGTASPSSILSIVGLDNGVGGSPTNAGGLRVYRPGSTTQFVGVDYSDGSQSFISANGDKGMNIVNYGATAGNNLRLVNNYASATISSGLFLDILNKVGIGTTSPNATLNVNGTITGRPAVSNASSTIDFSIGNQQYTTSSCGAYNLNNMKDGGSYTFVVQGGTAAACSFSIYSDAGSTALTVHMPPNHGLTTANTHTMYNFMVLGTHAYVSWIPGY